MLENKKACTPTSVPFSPPLAESISTHQSNASSSLHPRQAKASPFSSPPKPGPFLSPLITSLASPFSPAPAPAPPLHPSPSPSPSPSRCSAFVALVSSQFGCPICLPVQSCCMLCFRALFCYLCSREGFGGPLEVRDLVFDFVSRMGCAYRRVLVIRVSWWVSVVW